MSVVNQWNWRDVLKNPHRSYDELHDLCSLFVRLDAIVVDGDWIENEEARMRVDDAAFSHKAIIHVDSMYLDAKPVDAKKQHQVDNYAKTLKLRCLIGEFVPYEPFETVFPGGFPARKPITISDLRNNCRDAVMVIARMLFCKMCSEKLNLNTNEIGWLINKSHGGVAYLIKRYDDWVAAKQNDEINQIFNEANDAISYMMNVDSPCKFQYSVNKPFGEIRKYKNRQTDSIVWVATGRTDELLFTFDGQKYYNLYKDYPNNLTKEQKEIFDKENPQWAELFKDRQ
jgi:hypothetical protein